MTGFRTNRTSDHKKISRKLFRVIRNSRTRLPLSSSCVTATVLFGLARRNDVFDAIDVSVFRFPHFQQPPYQHFLGVRYRSVPGLTDIG